MTDNHQKSIPSNNVVIKLANLTKKFGSLTAVDQLSLEIIKGEILGFLGPNGAGKTTSINMICGLLRATECRCSYIFDMNERFYLIF